MQTNAAKILGAQSRESEHEKKAGAAISCSRSISIQQMHRQLRTELFGVGGAAINKHFFASVLTLASLAGFFAPHSLSSSQIEKALKPRVFKAFSKLPVLVLVKS